MSFRLVPKSVTLNALERRNGHYFASFLPNSVISGAYCVKVVDKTITMDNLRLLCLVANSSVWERVVKRKKGSEI